MTVPNGAIIIDSATGSDTAASGLGPATAVFGTGASLNSTSTVTLSADTPDLSGVSAGDLLWVDTTSGRQYSIIASVDDGADTVTCDDAFSVTESGRNWGIGGKRASLGSSARVWTTDVKVGWIIELADGHTETISSTLTSSVSGGTTGAITLRGESGATTMPILTFSNNGSGLAPAGYHTIRDIEFRNTNATKTASYAINGSGQYVLCIGLVINHATNYFYRAIQANAIHWDISNCDIGNTADVGIIFPNGAGKMCYNYIHDCTSDGVELSNSASGDAGMIMFNIFDTNGAHGLQIVDVGTLASVSTNILLMGNVFYNNTSNGIDIANSERGADRISMRNNIFVSNGGYGIDCNGLTADFFLGMGSLFDRNAFYNNTTAKYLPTDLPSENEIVMTGDPFTDAANGDFNINNTSGAGASLRASTVTL